MCIKPLQHYVIAVSSQYICTMITDLKWNKQVLEAYNYGMAKAFYKNYSYVFNNLVYEYTHMLYG